MMIPNKNNITAIKVFLELYFNIEGNYTISENGVIDITGNIRLNHEKFNQLNLTELPIQFGNITGFFDFDYSIITTMKGFPHRRNVLMKAVHYTVEVLSIIGSKNLLSLDNDNMKYMDLFMRESSLQSLSNLNCEEFYGNNLNLKEFGTNFNGKIFNFNNFPTPTALKKHTE